MTKKVQRFRSLPSVFVGGCLLCGLLMQVSAVVVRSGENGLIYTPYANEGQSESDNTVPDFSTAGYGGGGVEIPFVPMVNVPAGPAPAACPEECKIEQIVLPLQPSGGDDTFLIQCAINRVSALQPRDGGLFGGAVVLDKGTFKVSRPLKINTSGVVIRGAGSQIEGGTTIEFLTESQENLFEVQGNGKTNIVDLKGGLPILLEEKYSITDERVPVGSRTLSVEGASSLRKGDLIRIRYNMNNDWLAAIGMNEVTTSDGRTVKGWTQRDVLLTAHRIVESVSGDKVTLNAPVVQAIEKKYGGAHLQKCTTDHYIEHIGIEGLRLISSYQTEWDESHGWIAIHFSLGVRNAWVRQVTAQHFGHSLVTAQPGSMFITVEDCAQLDPISGLTPSNRHSFVANSSTNILFQRCLTRGGWNDFSTGRQTSGPNVFLDCVSTDAHHVVGPRLGYSTGELYDNVLAEPLKDLDTTPTNDPLLGRIQKAAGIRVHNSNTTKKTRGWTGAQIMIWNSKAQEIVVDAPKGAMNWSVGAIGEKAESSDTPAESFGKWESHQTRVSPRSLFLAQVEDTFGPNAAMRVKVPEQDRGMIWPQLKEWDGNGLTFDPLITWHDLEEQPIAMTPLEIFAILRDLPMRDFYTAMTWSKLNGPGDVFFANENTLNTTVTFYEEGRYQLGLQITDGRRTLNSSLVVHVKNETDFPTEENPIQLKGNVRYTKIDLTWPTLPDQNEYRYTLYRSDVKGELGRRIVTDLKTTKHSDRDLRGETDYTYVITRTDKRGYTYFYSTPLEIRTDEPEPVKRIVSNGDFGTKFDKLTAKEAGFRTVIPSGHAGYFDNVFRVWNPTPKTHTYMIQRDFREIVEKGWKDFSIDMQASLRTRGKMKHEQNLIGLFFLGNERQPLRSGLMALLRYEDGQMSMVIRNGATGRDLVREDFQPLVMTNGTFPIPTGVPYTFEVDGVFPDDENLEITFTLSDGEKSKSLKHTLKIAEIEGLSVGGITNLDNGFSVDFNSIILGIYE